MIKKTSFQSSLMNCSGSRNHLSSRAQGVQIIFEGLLRGKRVVTYGMPFYAGWGLTEDHCRCARRSRRLDLDELVAGCLLIYPRYVYDRARFAEPEIILKQLKSRRLAANHTNLILSSRLSRFGRKLINLVDGIFYAR